MAAESKSKKRKSGDDVVPMAKKVKTAKSAERPAPLKSALKKSKTETVESTIATEVAKPKKTKKTIAKVVEKGNTPEVETTTIVEAADPTSTELTPDQTAALLAGFSSSEDEDDEDTGIAISSLPAAPVSKKRAGEKSASNAETTPGVIFLSRVPHGFYEPQMRAYFSQFGDITHLRLARNKKTGKSQHFAFIEFASQAVAEIVAKTMDKYLLFNHLLQVRTVPREQVNEKMWKGGVKRGRAMPRNRLAGTKLKRGMEREVWEGRITREEEKRRLKAEQMKELGYDFEMPKMKKVSEVPVKAIALPEAREAAAGPQDAEDEVAKMITDGEAKAQTKLSEIERPNDAEEVEQSEDLSVKIVKKEKSVKRKTADGTVPVKKSKKVKVISTV